MYLHNKLNTIYENMPCFAAVGAIKREMGSWKWTLRTVGFQMLVAWIVAFGTYMVCQMIF